MSQTTFAPAETAASPINNDEQAFLSQKEGDVAPDRIPDLNRAADWKGWTTADFMTRDVLTVPAQGNLREAAEIFALYNISGAPVLDERGRLVGMLSESDLIAEAQRYADIPRLAVFGFHIIPSDRLWAAYRHSWAMEIANLMTRRLVTAGPDTPLLEIAKIMATQDVNRLPIVENHRLVGIITRADILRAFASLPSSELRKEAWQPPKGLRKPGRTEFRAFPDAFAVESGEGTETVNEDGTRTKYAEAVTERGYEANGYDGESRAEAKKPSWAAPGAG